MDIQLACDGPPNEPINIHSAAPNIRLVNLGEVIFEDTGYMR